MKKRPSKRNLQAEPGRAGLFLNRDLFRPGDRVCVAVSGGADSTALLRALLAERAELGIVLSALHVEHGLRGPSSARDAAFVAALAEEFSLPCVVIPVDTPKRAAERKESIEEAARNLRYEVFRETLSCRKADKIATAHTLDDQAETVLMKLLRGAWTEGLSGIHPVLELGSAGDGLRPPSCIRPILGVTRAEIETYLKALGQRWCEDESNGSLAHTRNRVRHELLPQLREYNPQIAYALVRVASNARAEEEHWQSALARLLPQLLLPGKPVRGGGRSAGTTPGSTAMALDLARLRMLDAGLRRRVVRATAERCGATLDFETTERLIEMVESDPTSGHGAHSAKRLELPGGVRVERSARELQFERIEVKNRPPSDSGSPIIEYLLRIPGTTEAPLLKARYTTATEEAATLTDARVRTWRAGDRVELIYSKGPKKVKEILERMGIRGEERVLWPVIEFQGKIVWMRGVLVAAEAFANPATAEPQPVTAVPPEVRCAKFSRIKVEETRY